MSILWNGDVVPCCIDFYGDYVIGNVKYSSLKELWNNKKMGHLRKALKQKKHDKIKICSKCDFLWQEYFFGIPKTNLRDVVTWLRENYLYKLNFK